MIYQEYDILSDNICTAQSSFSISFGFNFTSKAAVPLDQNCHKGSHD